MIKRERLLRGCLEFDQFLVFPTLDPLPITKVDLPPNKTRQEHRGALNDVGPHESPRGDGPSHEREEHDHRD